jgi:hypothetical protein
VACWAIGDFGFITGHSVPSIIILADGNLVLKPRGLKNLTISRSGNMFTSRHCFAIKFTQVTHMKYLYLF